MPVDVVLDLGVFLDRELNMNQQVKTVVRSCFFSSPTPQIGSAHPRQRSYTRTGVGFRDSQAGLPVTLLSLDSLRWQSYLGTCCASVAVLPTWLAWWQPPPIYLIVKDSVPPTVPIRNPKLKLKFDERVSRTLDQRRGTHFLPISKY